MSCYARHFDYAKFRAICDENNAILHSDMAHISGLVAAGVVPSPFEYSDVVTTTTHKSLRGPRGAMIFYRYCYMFYISAYYDYYYPFSKGVRSVTPKGEKIMYDFEAKINGAVFPGLQGGPHNHTIAGLYFCVCFLLICTFTGIAVCLSHCKTDEFVQYAKQILLNAQALTARLMTHGYALATGFVNVFSIFLTSV